MSLGLRRLLLLLASGTALISTGIFALAGIEPFTLTAQLDSAEGPDIVSIVEPGSTVYFSAQVPHPSDNLPTATYLFWQLYDHSGKPMPGFGNAETIAIAGGGTHRRTYTLLTKELPPGAYTVALTHQLASDPTALQQATIDFTLQEFEISITHFSLDDQPASGEIQSFHDEAALLAALKKRDTPVTRARLGAVQLRYALHFSAAHQSSHDPGDFLTALGYALAASAVLPQSATAWELVAGLAFPLRQDPVMLMHAETAFRQLIRLEPEDANARRGLFECLLAAGAHGEAVETGAWLLARDPDFATGQNLEHFTLACIYGMRTRTGEVALRDLLHHRPDHVQARLALAVMLRAQGLTGKARGVAQQILNTATVDPVLRREAASLIAAWEAPFEDLWEDVP